MKHTFVFAICCFTLSLFSCKTSETVTSTAKVKPSKTYTTESGLQYSYIQKGTGVKAKNGDQVSVHFIGKLTDGTEFENTYKKGAPISFVLGAGKVIKGWDEAVALLNVGDKGVFTIPPALGFGAIEIPGQIPANSVLIFEIELLEIKPATGN